MIQSESRGQVRILRFDRAEKRNALTPAMLRDLISHLDTSLSAHAIVLSGVGDIFCAGFDLSLCKGNDAVLIELLSALAKAARTMRAMPCPVVVSAHGAAIAGGCALLAAADIAVTTNDAKIGYPVVRLGISPAVSAPALRLTIGDGPARTRLLDTATVWGREAVRLGLAAESLPTAPECEARAIAIAMDLASKPRHAVALTKQWLNEVDGSLDEARHTAALSASLGLVGGAEQHERLAELWSKKA